MKQELLKHKWVGYCVLKLLRFFLPPFHPLKYKWISYWYGKQEGGYFNEETKYPCTVNENYEYIEKYKKKSK